MHAGRSDLEEPIQQGDGAVDGAGGVQLGAGGQVQLQCIPQLVLQAQLLLLQSGLCTQYLVQQDNGKNRIMSGLA